MHEHEAHPLVASGVVVVMHEHVAHPSMAGGVDKHLRHPEEGCSSSWDGMNRGNEMNQLRHWRRHR
eukprot:scaffold30965_cov80-Skeletonema_dohrnii-CCMP3373.AAC.1